jgi:hypothetical protein
VLWQFAVELCGNAGWPLLLLFAVFIGFALFHGMRAGKNPEMRWRYCFLMLWMVFPIAFIVAVSFVRPLFVDRYFIFCLPPLLMLASAGIAHLRSRWLFAAVFLVFTALSVHGTLAYYQRNFSRPSDDWRDVAHIVLDNAQPSDAAVFFVGMGRMPYEYYRSLAMQSGPSIVYPHHGERIGYLDFVEKPDFDAISRALSPHPRVWLVLTYVETPSGPESTAVRLRELVMAQHPTCQSRTFTGIEVLLCR